MAKTDGEGRIIPLDDSERRNLADYIDTIHTTGIPTTIVSTTADTIRYNLEVYYDPAVPSSVVREQVGQALETFKTSLSFDAVFYAQRLVDAVMHAEGVVTVKVVRLEHKTSAGADFAPVDVLAELAAGYFEYAAEGNTLTLTSIKSL